MADEARCNYNRSNAITAARAINGAQIREQACSIIFGDPNNANVSISRAGKPCRTPARAALG